MKVVMVGEGDILLNMHLNICTTDILVRGFQVT